MIHSLHIKYKSKNPKQKYPQNTRECMPARVRQIAGADIIYVTKGKLADAPFMSTPVLKRPLL